MPSILSREHFNAGRSSGGYWRDLIPADLSDDKVPEFIAARMREAGDRYAKEAGSRGSPEGAGSPLDATLHLFGSLPDQPA